MRDELSERMAALAFALTLSSSTKRSSRMALRIPVLNSALELNTSSREVLGKSSSNPKNLTCSVTPAVCAVSWSEYAVVYLESPAVRQLISEYFKSFGSTHLLCPVVEAPEAHRTPPRLPTPGKPWWLFSACHRLVSYGSPLALLQGHRRV